MKRRKRGGGARGGAGGRTERRIAEGAWRA